MEKQTYRSGPYKDIYAQGVKVGNALYISGQVGIGPDGEAGSTFAEQTQLAYANIQHVLKQFDLEPSSIVDETWFVCDMAELNQEMKASFGARAAFYQETPAVAQTVVEVNALIMPSLKIEIKCIAHCSS